MTTEFSSLGLHPEIVQTLTKIGYITPTEIQTAVIPAILAGQDVIGQSQTGSGKTAAFSLPILQNLESGKRYVQCLVVTPTRELCMQVAEAMQTYGSSRKINVLPVFGGQSYFRQISQIKKGVEIVVGTPGRLLDLIRQKILDLGRVSAVVLDEADEMLSMGFIADVEAILEKTATGRQTTLFSATMPGRIRQLAESHMHNPESFTIGKKQVTVQTVEQRYILVNESDKLAALTRLFEVEPIVSALIFARTRIGTNDLVNELVTRGFPAEALNGDLNQDARIRVLERFKNSQLKVLVATDVAARGLDIDDISHVFNYDLPQDPELYVHRIGRTGRAGKKGVAISLSTPRERGRLRRIESYVKKKIELMPLPAVEKIQEHREEQLIEKLMVWLKRGRCSREKEIVTDLVEKGFDPLEIAAVALKVARAEEKQRPIAPVSEISEKPSDSFRRSRGRNRGIRNSENGSRISHEEGMIRLSLNIGKADGIRASNIVGSLSHHSNIPGSVIGRISIEKQHTYVDVPEKLAGKVLSRKTPYRIGRNTVTIQRM